MQQSYRSYLFSFRGRASRSQFWSTFLLVGMLNVLYFAVLLRVMTSAMTADVPSSGTGMIFIPGLCYSLLTLWVGLALWVRRFHDMDKSGWFILLLLVPVLNFFVIFWAGLAPGSKDANRFGPAQPDISTGKAVMFLLLGIVLCVALTGGMMRVMARFQVEMLQHMQAQQEKLQALERQNAAPDGAYELQPSPTAPNN